MKAAKRRTAAALAAALTIAACGQEDGAVGERPAGEPAAERRGLALVEIGSFDQPLGVYQPPHERGLLLVPEKGGVIRALRGGKPLRQPFLDLRRFVTATGVEQGLAGMAFPPNHRQSRRFYVSYTAEGNGELRIEEFRRSRAHPARALPGTRRTVLVVRQPEPIHNGGAIAFGPDGKLYIGAGDGGPSYDPENRGQDRGTLLGKLLRIEPRRVGPGRPYGIPKGNPYRGHLRRRPEIYALGLRNPWRFSFDAENGAIWIGDVGQDQIEEIDVLKPRRLRGANFGWSGFEGTLPYKRSQRSPKAIRPFHEYLHEGRCSVTGGYVGRGAAPRPLQGRYVYGDFCDGRLRALTPPYEDGLKDDRRLGLKVPALVSFGTDEAGRLYAVSLEGPVYRIAVRSTPR